MFDIWNNDVDIAKEVFRKDNYVIEENHGCHNGVCYIFFSSNNIWFPNTEEAFRRSFIDNDYYEWLNFAKLPAEKFIFVRDIYKSWYVTGINSRMDSADAVIDFLRKETLGMKVITVGSSAGGYMAALVASRLNAEYSICFSAQFDLTVEGALGANPFLKKYSHNANKNRYYNIVNTIRKSKTDIFYFMPAFSEDDKEQMNRVVDIENIHILKIATHRHGVPLLRGNLFQLLQMDKESLINLFDSKKDQIVGILPMSMKLSGFRGTCCCIKNELVRIIGRYIRPLINDF